MFSEDGITAEIVPIENSTNFSLNLTEYFNIKILNIISRLKLCSHVLNSSNVDILSSKMNIKMV